MKQAIDGQLSGRDGIGDGVDQERHVVVDDADAHPAVAGLAADGFDRQRKLARLAARGEGGEEFRGITFGFAAEALGLPGERVSGQRLSD